MVVAIVYVFAGKGTWLDGVDPLPDLKIARAHLTTCALLGGPSNCKQSRCMVVTPKFRGEFTIRIYVT